MVSELDHAHAAAGRPPILRRIRRSSRFQHARATSLADPFLRLAISLRVLVSISHSSTPHTPFTSSFPPNYPTLVVIMASVVGFDLGNNTSKIGVARQRGVDIIANEVSNRQTP